MTTIANGPSKQQIQETTVKPSTQNVSAKVTQTEEGYQIIEKTVNTSSKDTNVAANEQVKLSGGGTSDMDKGEKDEEHITASTKKSWFIESSNMVSEYIHKNFPALEVFYEEKIKSHFELLIETYTRTPAYYEKYVKPNLANIHLVHSLCMIFWGGSCYSFVLLLSFVNVYIEDYTNEILTPIVVEKYIQKIWDFQFDNLSVHSKMFELKIVKSAHEIWVLFVIFYAVWTVPLLASLTIALSTLKFVENTMISREMIQCLEKPISQLKAYCRWPRYVVFVFSALLFVLFPPNIQASVLMSCLGYQKLLSVSDGFKQEVSSIKGPKNIDGITVASWICVAISIVLQCFRYFQSSLLGCVVTLGLFIPRETKLVVKKQE